MVYSPQTWTDGSAGGTPLSAARLTHIESGIQTLEQTTLPAAIATQHTTDNATYEAPIILPVATGVAATDTANLTAAINTANANGGRIVKQWGNGAYAVNAALPTITRPDVLLDFGGSAYAVITHSGNGDCFRIQMSPFAITPAGQIRGVTIKGNNGASACGVHLGDTIGFALDDVVIQDYTTGTGLHFDNQTGWTERTKLSRVRISNCAKLVRFTIGGTGTDSFGYTDIEGLWLTVNAGQIGLSFENNSYLYHTTARVFVNAGGAAPVYVNVQDTASLAQTHMTLVGEGGVGPVRFQVGATATCTPEGFFDTPGTTDSVTAGGVFGLTSPAYHQQITVLPFGTPSSPVGDGFGLYDYNTGYPLGVVAYCTAQNSAATWKVPLPAGTWAITILGQSNSNRGIITVAIDGTMVGTIDQYSAGPVAQRATISGVVLAALINPTSCRNLTLSNPTKNAASSGYQVMAAAIILSKTA